MTQCGFFSFSRGGNGNPEYLACGFEKWALESGNKAEFLCLNEKNV